MTGRERPPSEKQVQAAVLSFFRGLGYLMVPTSQYRRSGLTVGLPDLIGWHRATDLNFVFECKTYVAKGYDSTDPSTWHPKPLRPEQEAFAAAYGSVADRWYGFGGILDAHHLAGRMGLGKADRSGLFIRNDWANQLVTAAVKSLSSGSTQGLPGRQSTR